MGVNVEPTVEQLKARIAELEAKTTRRVSLSVQTSKTGSGAVSVYGMGRFPVSLHPEQWQKLAAFMPTIIEHVEAGLADGSLQTKSEKLASRAVAA